MDGAPSWCQKGPRKMKEGQHAAYSKEHWVKGTFCISRPSVEKTNKKGGKCLVSALP